MTIDISKYNYGMVIGPSVLLDTYLTQAVVLVVNLPIQGAKITQAAILPVWTPTPIPLPKPIVPEAPVTETWTFSTSITIAEGSKEQRAALRNYPRVGLEFNAVILNEEDRRNTYQMLSKYISRSFDYPNYVYSTKLTAAAVAGATKLFFDPAATDLRDGESIALFDPQLEITSMYTIATVDADGATLTSGLLDDAGIHFCVCPALRFRTTPIVGLTMNAIDGGFKLKLDSINTRTTERPDMSPTLNTYAGFFLLDVRPLANDSVDENFNQDMYWLDDGMTPPLPRTSWPIPFINGNRDYLIHRPEGMDYWRAVAAELKGRQKAFLLPTFRNDFPLTEVPALGATKIVSSNVQFFEFWRQKTYKYLRIVTQNGTIYRTILEVLPNYDVDGIPVSVEIKMDTALGVSAGDNIISEVSHVNVCRLDSDTMTLTHEMLDSIMSISVRTINE